MQLCAGCGSDQLTRYMNGKIKYKCNKCGTEKHYDVTKATTKAETWTRGKWCQCKCAQCEYVYPFPLKSRMYSCLACSHANSVEETFVHFIPDEAMEHHISWVESYVLEKKTPHPEVVTQAASRTAFEYGLLAGRTTGKVSEYYMNKAIEFCFNGGK